MTKVSKAGSLAIVVRCLAGLAALVATGSGTMAWAKNHPDAQKDAWAITLRVYDYAHLNRPALLAAEGEATRILGHAGVNARWVDCPTSLAEWNNYPNCQSEWQVNDYVVRVMPKGMDAVLEKSQDSLGSAMDCGIEPCCIASVFYDRVLSLERGATASAAVLLGLVMAHEIGHLLLGPNSHSPAGIMHAPWSAHELRPEACIKLVFTAEQSRRMKSWLAAQAQTWQAQTRALELGR